VPTNTTDLLSFIYNPIRDFVQNFGEHPIYLVEIAVLAFIVWRVYLRIKGTQAEQLLKGILVIVAALLLSKAFHLEIISRVLENLVSVVLVGLVVIFQPELRRILGYLGQSSMFTRNILDFNAEGDIKNLIYSITEAVNHLSKTHTGALIVLEESPSAETYLEVGTPVNADVSPELILTIFHPHTPLHDGAIVINGTKIIAAGVLLPLTEDPKLSWQYGTRHRAAIGMSEISNSLCIVVSEETGDISVAKSGVLKKYTSIEEFSQGLTETLEKIYPQKKKVDLSSAKLHEMLPSDFKILNIFSGMKK
jgi:diadenylate cyclase